MRRIQFIPFLLSVIICFSAAIIGSVFTTQAIPTWYASLNKPVFSPPNWIFGPVWSILYLCMAVSLYIIWLSKSNKKLRKQALIYFFIQLVLNTLWSIIFFGLKSPLLAFIEILVLWAAIFMTIQSSGKVSKIAARLLYPYLIWVSFATILNFFIIILNP